MPDIPTLGQICYEGAWRVHEELYPKAKRAPWRELHPAHKRGWEAAAQAVLDAATLRAEAQTAVQAVVQAAQARLAREEDTPSISTPGHPGV